jgi:hypothetical protein
MSQANAVLVVWRPWVHRRDESGIHKSRTNRRLNWTGVGGRFVNATEDGESAAPEEEC